MKMIEYAGSQSRSSLVALSLALTVLVGGMDYLTGRELAFSIFYVLPISLAAWFVGRRAGIVMSILGASLWLMADLLAEHVYSYPAIPYWNATVRLGFFLIVTYALAALRSSRARQEELGQFIVHDLRSPLSGVMIGLQTLQDIGGETMDPIQEDVVKTCLASCDRMSTLISSLLDLSRLESGQMLLHLSDIGVRELVDSSLSQVTAWAARNRATLTFHPNTDIQTVYADQELTERVLVNLLSNAIKFSPPESAVTVSVAPNDADMVAFGVTDQGPGIPKEWVNRVFDKFAQVDADGEGKSIGAGLGLTFCRLAVEAQGGRIWLESEVGKGTTVTFTLPKSAR